MMYADIVVPRSVQCLIGSPSGVFNVYAHMYWGAEPYHCMCMCICVCDRPTTVCVCISQTYSGLMLIYLNAHMDNDVGMI